MLKTVSYRTLLFPEYGMANASNFTRGFTPASNPERGNNIWATKLAFIYVKMTQAKNSVTPYILGFPLYEMTNTINFKCARQQPQKG